YVLRAPELYSLALHDALPICRLLLPKLLQEYAGIKKDMILSAQGNKVELWYKDTYYTYIREHASGFSDLAAEVAGGGFTNPFEKDRKSTRLNSSHVKISYAVF